MKARYVSLTPWRSSYSFRSFARIATTFDMSISKTVVTCADVSSERRMCSAMPFRIGVIGSNVSPAAGAPGAAAGAGAGGEGGAAAAGGGGGGTAAGAGVAGAAA
jgi:hypothetical protein